MWQSLVVPFYRHVPTFGIGAVAEALRVSVANIGPHGSHGSSWQQGGCYLLAHDTDGGTLRCVHGWSEAFPGDWQQPGEMLAEAGVTDAAGPELDYRQRLAFVIKQRKAHTARMGATAGHAATGGAAAGWGCRGRGVVVLVLLLACISVLYTGAGVAALAS